jgi:hypothetical protein
MFAVTTMTRHTTIALFLAACGGAAPVHNGYPAGDKDPWASPAHVQLKENGEGAAEGNISFPKRQRAKWYVVDLPAPGSLQAKLSMDPTTTGADVGIEILDAGFNVAAEAQNDDDIGQEKKTRFVKDARTGKSYIHIFAINRGDELAYKLRVKYIPSAVPHQKEVVRSDGDAKNAFPWTIPNLPPLPAVPAGDEKHAGNRTPVKPPPVTEKPEVKPDEPPDPAEGAPVHAEITEFGSAAGGGVRIIINKGSGAGVEEGWTGYVIDNKTKRSVPKGSFKIKKVGDDESEATVNLPLDVLQANRKVSLKPSK